MLFVRKILVVLTVGLTVATFSSPNTSVSDISRESHHEASLSVPSVWPVLLTEQDTEIANTAYMETEMARLTLEAEQAAEAAHQAEVARLAAIQPNRTNGPHSDAWWRAVAICEQGGRNDPYYGYFSVMDGSTGGGQSWEQQLVIVNGIIARHGDRAWAASCVQAGYNAAPSG